MSTHLEVISKSWCKRIITLTEFFANVNLDKNVITMHSGIMCSYNKKFCMDIEGGYSFWDILPRDSCKKNEYTVVYDWKANKMRDATYQNVQTIYRIRISNICTYNGGTENLCGYTMIATDHPRIFFYELKGEKFKIGGEPMAVEYLDIFTYINSKFVYVANHIKRQMNPLY